MLNKHSIHAQRTTPCITMNELCSRVQKLNYTGVYQKSHLELHFCICVTECNWYREAWTSCSGNQNPPQSPRCYREYHLHMQIICEHRPCLLTIINCFVYTVFFLPLSDLNNYLCDRLKRFRSFCIYTIYIYIVLLVNWYSHMNQTRAKLKQ